jgi:polyhydroxyalkanoate synthesis regulator phasin
MAWTQAEEDRIKTLETVINSLQTAVANLMSKMQMRQLIMIKQAQVDELTRRVETLERLVQIIEQHLL